MNDIFSTILGDFASAAGHDIGGSNAIENFEQSFYMLGVPLFMISARDLLFV